MNSSFSKAFSCTFCMIRASVGHSKKSKMNRGQILKLDKWKKSNENLLIGKEEHKKKNENTEAEEIEITASRLRQL